LVTWAFLGDWAMENFAKRMGWEASKEDQEKAWAMVGSPQLTVIESTRNLDRSEGGSSKG
jgi:hypothetical protein